MNRIPQDISSSSNQDIREQKEQIEFEMAFFEGLLNVDSQNIRVLVPLAENYSLLGSYRQCLPLDLRLTKLRPERAIFWYNLSCSYCRLKMFDEAINALREALNRGYDDFPHLLRDNDLKPLNTDPRFISLIESHLDLPKFEYKNIRQKPEKND